MNRFEGVFPIINTTFHDDGSIDVESQRRLVRYVLDAGAHGVGLFANASEGYTLADWERRELLQVIVGEVDGQVPVIVSTGHTGTDMAVTLSREAEQAGADGLMVMPPYFMRPDTDGVFQYYTAISDAVGIPIQVQDAPLMTQVPMGVPLLARMAQELERVRLVKVEAPPTAPKISALGAAAEGTLLLHGGLNGQFFLEELGRGSRGVMPGSDMTDMFVRVWNRHEEGDLRGAWEEFTRHLPLIRYELQPGLGVSVMKHNLKAGGVISSTRVRHPTRSLDPVGVRELEFLRQGLDLLALHWGR